MSMVDSSNPKARLTREGLPDRRITDGRYTEKYGPRTWSWWYDAVIDWMLTNPDKTKRDCAREFDVSYQYILLLTNTDMFKQKFAERRARLSEALDGEIAHNLGRVAKKSLELIEDRLEQDAQKRIRFDDLKNLADMSLSRMGYGITPSGGPVNVQVNLIGASPGAIESARSHIRQVSPPVIDQEPPPLAPPEKLSAPEEVGGSPGDTTQVAPATAAPVSVTSNQPEVDDACDLQELEEMLRASGPGAHLDPRYDDSPVEEVVEDEEGEGRR